VQKQVGDFIETTLLRQLGNRIASVTKSALNGRNSRLSGDDAFQPGGINFSSHESSLAISKG
jgi:hypothetical protein